MPQYTIVFEEHLDPIKKRGKVVLTEALPEGSSLQIIRKTPIIADFTAEALKPFPSEAFENALDRICFIQQEIEGHLCDCRGEEYPPGTTPPTSPPPGPNLPECQPYNCNAFVNYALANGYQAIDFSTVQYPGVLLPASLGDGLSVDPTYVGMSLITTATQPYYLWTVAGNGFDQCADKIYGLGIHDDAVWLRTPWRLYLAEGGFGGTAIMHHGGISVVVAEGSIMNLGYTITVPNYPAANRSLQIGLGWSNATGFSVMRYGPASIVLGKPTFNAGANFLSLELGITNVRIEFISGAGVYAPFGTWVYKVQSNDTVYSGSFDDQLTQGNGSLSAFDDWTLTFGSGTRIFQDSRAKIFALVHRQEGYDVDELYNFYRQNFIDYTPPESCTFTGDEI